MDRRKFQNNYVTQHGTLLGCDGTYITDVRGGVVQHNLNDRAGTSGIELHTADRITPQHNETTGTIKEAGGGQGHRTHGLYRSAQTRRRTGTTRSASSEFWL